jgi:hypothetical protein
MREDRRVTSYLKTSDYSFNKQN